MDFAQISTIKYKIFYRSGKCSYTIFFCYLYVRNNDITKRHGSLAKIESKIRQSECASVLSCHFNINCRRLNNGLSTFNCYCHIAVIFLSFNWSYWSSESKNIIVFFQAIGICINVRHLNSSSMVHFVASYCSFCRFTFKIINKGFVSFRHFEIECIVIFTILKSNFLISYFKTIQTRIVEKLHIIYSERIIFCRV